MTKAAIGLTKFEVGEGLEPVGDDVVVDPYVLVDQDIAEAHRPADRAREHAGADAVLAEQSYRVPVVRRRADLRSRRCAG